MTGDSDWTLRYYRDGDEQGMLDCINSAFGEWPGIDLQVSPLDHLRWKLGPAVAGRRYHIIAESGERIIGCGLVRPCRVKLGHQIVPAVLYGDMAVLPQYQNRGIMGAVWDHQDEVGDIFALSIGISDNAYVGKEFDKRTRNHPFANRIELFEREMPSMVSNLPGTGTVAGADCFDERIDAFCADAMRPFRFAMARDVPWLNYRYEDKRAGRYAIRLALDSEAIIGYAVLTEARGKGFIADLLVLPERLDALGALLADASAHFASRGVDRVRSWLPSHHPYRAAFERAGYAPLRTVGRLNPGPFGDTDLRFLFEDERAAVHYMAGDTDVV